MKSHISQREAHRLRKQVRAQAQTISSYECMVLRIRRGNLGEGIEIYREEATLSSLAWTIVTAQKLGHLVVARYETSNTVSYRALPLPSEDVNP
jgi:hypothetical protein